MISADSHAGADILDYKEYLPRHHHEDFDEWAAAYRSPYDSIKSDEADRNWNSDRRLRDLEEDGIVAEVIYPNTVPPFFPSFALLAPHPGPADSRLRWAGIRAHNRWLADFCNEAPGRRAGVFQVFLDDIEAAVAEIKWCKNAGLAGGMLLHGVPPGSPVPQLHDEIYEPIWAVCEDLQVPVNHHAGTSTPPPDWNPVALSIMKLEMPWFAHRALWHLMYSGVFTRHPKLKFILAEQGAAWIPEVLELLDRDYRRSLEGTARDQGGQSTSGKLRSGLGRQLDRRPSEYWQRQCQVAATFMCRYEAQIRDRIGIEAIMWGNDYPHDEGTWPHSRQALQAAFANLPSDEVAAMVGGNAARTYSFDLSKLRKIAERVGPSVDEVTQPLKNPPPGSASSAFDDSSASRPW